MNARFRYFLRRPRLGCIYHALILLRHELCVNGAPDTTCPKYANGVKSTIMKKFNMMMSDETRRDIRLIRSDYDLSNDAEAVRLAVQKLARHIREQLAKQAHDRQKLPAIPDNLPDSWIAEYPSATVGTAMGIHNSRLICPGCKHQVEQCSCEVKEQEYVEFPE